MLIMVTYTAASLNRYNHININNISVNYQNNFWNYYA